MIMFWRPYEDYGWLSQWSDDGFIFGEKAYSSCEQFMMAMKAKLFGDAEVLQKIMDCHNPKRIRELGRQVKNFNEGIWDVHKWGYVIAANFAKFSQNEDIRLKLMQTDYEELVEGSPYDCVWGVGTTSRDRNEWRGTNLLGKALMIVREMLRNQN